MATEKGYEIKQYKRRWLNMLVFAVYAINGGCQFAQFTIIKDVVMKYYGVSSMPVEWTTNIFMLAYAILIFPSLYLWDKVVSSFLWHLHIRMQLYCRSDIHFWMVKMIPKGTPLLFSQLPCHFK